MCIPFMATAAVRMGSVMRWKMHKQWMFLLSAIRGHVHKKDNHDQEECSIFGYDDGYAKEEEDENSSCALEDIREEERDTEEGWFDLQTEEIMITEAEGRGYADTVELTQEEEIKVQDEQLIVETQIEEIESEQSEGKTEEELFSKSETEADVIPGNTGEETADNSEGYSSEYTETELTSDGAEVGLFSYTQTENDSIEITESAVYVLPETGGAGTDRMEQAGYLCICLSVISLLVSRRLTERIFRMLHGQDTLRENERN